MARPVLITAIMLALLVMARAVHAVDQNDLPPECADADFSTTGRPVMFPYRAGMALGISTGATSFTVGGPMKLSVWVVNQSDEEQSLMVCSDVEWWTLDLNVYDANWRRVQTLREQERLQHPESKSIDVKICFRNFPVKVAPHTCSRFNDHVRFVTTDLARRYRLKTGEYFVTPKELSLPVRALRISVVDSGVTPN